MPEFMTTLGFMPHGHCYLWTPSLLWTFVVADTIIVMSYFSIPFGLLYFVRKRKDLQFNWIFMLFSAFIFSCGVTHLLSIWTIWHPDYWLDAMAKAVTAIISLVTMVLLWSLIPRLLKIPSTEQLEALVTRLEHEIEHRKIAEAQLKAANKELESFSYSVSHDLRAPLRAINGFAQILIRRYRDSLDEEGGHYLDNVVTASDRMGVLIEELLHYSRTARSLAQAVPVPLTPVVVQLKNTFGERIAAASADFEVMEPLATPLGDPTLIGQILTNLVDNALTYCTRDGTPRVTLSSLREDGKVVLRVADNGIGIAPEYHEKIFQVFQRLHSNEEYPGTGIGLAIVAKAARMMEGEVSIESALGAGSIFSVRLPAASEEGSET